MTERRISLASGVLPECEPLTIVAAAVSAGYSDVGLMVRADQWRRADEAQILDQCAAHGLGILDVEVLWIPKGGVLDSNHQFIVDVGRRLSADHVLVVSDESDPDKLAPALRQIEQWCDGSDLRPMLEFLRITTVDSLQQARELLQICDTHHFGILLDALHLARSKELFSPLQLDAAAHTYIQLCDGYLECADDPQSLLVDALDLRCAAGEGELPLQDLMAALPGDVPLSLEVRSAAYRERYPQPADRAAAVLQQTQKFLREVPHV